MRTCYLATVLFGLCCAFAQASPSPPPKPNSGLPPEVEKQLKRYAELFESVMEQSRKIIAKEKDEDRRELQMRKLAKMVRRSLEEPVVYLKNVLAHPDKTLGRPSLDREEVRAIERTIEEYRKRLAEAVKKGYASPEEKPPAKKGDAPKKPPAK